MPDETSSSLTPLDLTVRYFVYEQFARHGQPPSVQETAESLQLPPTQAQAIFQRLHEHHAFFLEPGTTRIRMAHPFSAVPTPFRVIIDSRIYWANCAWDMLGIPVALHRQSACLETTCADCGEAVVITLADGRLDNSTALIHFAVPFRHWYDDLIVT